MRDQEAGVQLQSLPLRLAVEKMGRGPLASQVSVKSVLLLLLGHLELH
jgi:hypothetical protein